MRNPFLTAEWRKLILVNYTIDPSLLSKYVPKGTEIDLWNGKCYVSLVGFMFLNTKVKGCKIPWHINFEEVNLRFYVKRVEKDETKRGVAFIKEIVPKPIITAVARTIYKEPYHTLPMRHNWSLSDFVSIEYQWKVNNQFNTIRVKAEPQSKHFEVNSEADFITEHYWGYTKLKEHTNEYEVAHPKWKVFNVLDSTIEVDFKASYGSEFEFLNKLQPASVMLAEGSEISVGNKRILKF